MGDIENDPDFVHETLCSLARTQADLDYEVGRWLLAAKRLKVHERLAFPSFAAYVEHVFDIDGRKARERIRVAEELESLTLLASALRNLDLSWSAVREISRVATAENEELWIEECRGLSARQIEAKVAGLRKGDAPSVKPTEPVRKRITLEVSEEAFALFQEARTAMTRESGGSVSDDALVRALARALLAGGARDEGVAAYQIAIVTCDVCRKGSMRAGAGQVPVDEATLERAGCDAQLLGKVDGAEPPRASQSIPPKVRRAVVARDGGRCAVPGCRNAAFVDVHHTDRRADGGSHDPDGLSRSAARTTMRCTEGRS
ncbi:MAG TPA: HNH endonuclease signature motif containing protein [Sandaracinaceae bacterium]